ncbi:MAG: universal stress protein [Aquamicrobium sp.]|uniref:universal stress protein n=1 Tax=Aquamicrobium sp. TaxID=1872579 RepID=UPI00349E6447|nr:universal stress protein [Aquamicrobium sp.]
MVSKRLSREAGHRRKFLAVVDNTPECERAIAYASWRARSTGGAVVLLYVIDTADFQQWLGVEQIMREEANATARAALDGHAARVRDKAGVEPELVVREGSVAQEIHKLIEEDQDIAILVLAAGGAKEGPGPLVASIATGKGTAFPVPVTVVPASLTDEEIETLA